MLAAGCNRSPQDATRHFRRAVSEPCPLWPEDFLRFGGPPSCPFPIGDSGPRPCAIEYYLGADPQPRLVRRLAFSSQGRVTGFSDHRGERTVEARRTTYALQNQTLEIQHFALLCEEPTPSYLWGQQLRYDSQGRLSHVASGAGQPLYDVEYRFTPHWLSDRYEVRLGKRTLRVDERGYIVGEDFANHERARAAVTAYNGRIQEVDYLNADGEETANVQYVYAGPGKPLAALEYTYPQGPAQRYRFVYDCQEGPAMCVPQAERETYPRTRQALSRDPDGSHFVARDCSDQFRYGPRLCGAVKLPERGLQARCCNTDQSGLQLELHSRFASPRVRELRLRWGSLEHLSSTHCRSERFFVDCRFDRAALKKLPPGQGELSLFTADGGVNDTMKVDLGALIKAAQ